ncbi:MAG: OPT/YSL family transporter [Halobacteriovoraceae bacterium]|nr:OPT/YSL family transporter [Halobacteriovoraceae bacterium]
MSSVNTNEIKKSIIGEYRELTVAAVLLGLIQGIILNIAFVYAALKLGFSIGGSTVAAIMGYALLKGILGKGTSIENNINQTIASGINTAGTGVVFTLPALFLLNKSYQEAGLASLSFSPWPFIIAGIAGSFLGVVLIIPLRKQMIDLDRLRFPSGVAVTSIIRSGSSGLGKAKLLGTGFLISAIWKVLLDTGVFPEEFNFSFGLLPEYLSPYVYLSLMNLAAGLLAGKGGLPFLAGGVLAWWVISPMAVNFGWTEGVEKSAEVGMLYGKMMKPLGIGTLIGGALMGVIMTFPAIKSALRSLMMATQTAKTGGKIVGHDEMPFNVLIYGLVFSVILFFCASYMIDGVTFFQALLVSIVGPLWLGLASLIVAQATGMTDISPMSGMALITVTIIMFLLNKNIAAAMVVAVAVCVAIGQAADMMQDLKTGFMIGGRPIKQGAAQFALTWIGVIISVGTVYVLWESPTKFGPGTPLPAPQAGVLMGIINGLKDGSVPIDKYILGGTIGAILTSAPMAGLGVLIGLAMYLPFSITLGYGIGCLAQMFLEKTKGPAFCEHKLVPFAAGLIIGEALTGVISAFIQILKS